MRQVLVYLCYLVLLTLLGSCASSNESTLISTSEDGHYTSSFPTRDVSTQLTTIQQSVLRLTSTSIYVTYFFGDDDNLTLEMLYKANLNDLASDRSTIDQSKAGTAVSILQNDRHTALLTARHVLIAPDTLISYKRGTGIPANKFIRSAGIKIKQRNYLHTYNKLEEVDVLATNQSDDLALIKVDRPEDSFDAPPLPLNIGSAQNLKPGSFLYVFGYPLGSPMVTRGIVSAPNYDGRGTFLTDALFNHGISGGLIVASRDNFRSFDWVGMAATASASEQYFLVPDPSNQDRYSNFETYKDTIFVSQKKLINYGVTQATPIEKILKFLYRNEDDLDRLGLSVTDLGGQ